jgi:hypothetical protein
LDIYRFPGFRPEPTGSGIFGGPQSSPCPQAAILFDKFHVLRHVNEALDKIRKSE